MAEEGRNEAQRGADGAALRLLRLCLRSRWDRPALDKARRLAQEDEIDWRVFARVAGSEGLAPLLHEVLRDQAWVPARVQAELRQAHRRNAARNAFLLRALEEALGALSQAGVQIVLLKGAALACTVYERAALRPMRDLDLLVRQDDLPAALRTLGSLGYKQVEMEAHPGLVAAYENEVLLHKPDLLDVPLELHWSLFDLPYYQRELPVEWFWQTAEDVALGQARARVLGPEAQILHLCGHLALHHSQLEASQLLWLHDVAEVCARHPDRIDWALVLRQAQACGLVLSLQQVLPQIAGEWGAPIPPEILSGLAALQPSPDEARAFAWLTAKHRPVAQRFWADLASMPSWRRRLHYAWLSLFPSTAYMQHRYGIRHRWLVPIYYPYRWLLGLRSAL